MIGFADTYLVPYSFGQHALLKLMDTFKESLDEKEVAGTSLMDLSKAFDCIEHELLIP